MNFQEKTIKIDGSQLNYRVASNESESAQEAILLHGWGCQASTMALFEDTIVQQCPDVRVYNLDLPGFGKSDEPKEVYGIREYVSVLEKFIRLNGIHRPILIGHSFGGRMSILYSALHPEDVHKVILVDSAGIKPKRELKYYAKVYSFKLAKKILPLLVGKGKSSEIIDKWRGKAGSADYAAASPKMRAILSKVVNEDLTEFLPKIKAPTLLIWGENDTATPISDARTMEKLIPDAGLVSYPGCGHYSFLDNPVQTRAVVASFINSTK